jgi:hypothetical protein
VKASRLNILFFKSHTNTYYSHAHARVQVGMAARNTAKLSETVRAVHTAITAKPAVSRVCTLRFRLQMYTHMHARSYTGRHRCPKHRFAFAKLLCRRPCARPLPPSTCVFFFGQMLPALFPSFFLSFCFSLSLSLSFSLSLSLCRP